MSTNSDGVITQENLKTAINEALIQLYNRDSILFERGVHEQCIAFRFGIYLEKFVNDMFGIEYNLDAEYNRNGFGSKTFNNEVYGKRPDFIIHKRGRNNGNIFVMPLSA